MKMGKGIVAGVLAVLLLQAVCPSLGVAGPKKGSSADAINRALLRLENGLVYMRMRKPDLALEEFKKALAIDPGLAVIESNIGYAYLAKGEWAQAQDAFTRALRLDGNYGNALYGMALISLQNKSIEKAIDYIEKSLKAGPPYAERYLQLGVLHLSAKNVDGAIADWKEALTVDSENLQALNNLGGVYLMQGKVEQGMEQIKKALVLAPNFADAHNNLGIGYMQGKKDYASAQKEFEQAIRIRPNYVDGQQNLAICLFLQKEYDKAKEHFLAVLKAQPQLAKPNYYLAAIAAVHHKDKDAAVQYLGKAIALDATLKESAKKEPSFESIKNLEGFKKLIQ